MSIEEVKHYSKIWSNYFKKHAFGNCQVCGHNIRVMPVISRFLKLNYFKNVKQPQVCFIDDIPICYCCASLGETIQEIMELFNENPGMKLDKHRYIAKWYELNNMCVYCTSPSKNKFCGSKDIYDDGMCQTHAELVENDDRCFKRAKY